MEATVKLDEVLDLVYALSVSVHERVQDESQLSSAYNALWGVYKDVAELYDDIRRLASE